MLIKDVKKLSPMERFLYFIQERESIRLKKEAGEPKPWTDDEILQSYRFCNVRRMDDKVSQWLLKNWYKPNFNHQNMLVACVIARHFNKPETLGEITQYAFGEAYRPALLLKRIQQLKSEGRTVFSAAYMIHADASADKSEMVINRVVQPFFETPPKVDRRSLQKSVEAISGYWNIGSFMAGQIVADLRWAISGKWEDREVWAPIGPGSHRGMNRLLERPLKQKMSQEEFLDKLQEVIGEVQDAFPSIARRLEAIDVQNCLCETDKYSRALFNEGRPKQRYNGL